MRRASKIDRNQPEIVEDLRSVGATVTPLHTVGDGCPDLLVGYMGVTYVMEVKDPEREVKAYRERNNAKALTEDQHNWHLTWQGQKAIVWDSEEALAVIGVKCVGPN